MLSLHHVQLAVPSGREDDARAFFVGVLGMTELAKPPGRGRQLSGHRRFYLDDCFGNRLEFLEPGAQSDPSQDVDMAEVVQPQV